MAQTIPEVSIGLNRQALNWLNVMVNEGVITDTAVAAADTVAGLRATAFAGPETARRFYEMWQKSVDRAKAIGTLTDALILSLTTVAGLRALFTTQDSLLTATQCYTTVG